VTLTGTAHDLRVRIAEYAEQGVPEIVYQPTGDIEQELESLVAVAQSL